MIRGAVNDSWAAIVRLRLWGANGTTTEIDGIVDTGFTGSLTLPGTIIAELKLPVVSAGTSVLADGSSVSYGVYSAEIEWDGAIRTVLASELGDECLIGMRLLSGYDLRIQVKPRGMMEANKMP